MGRVAHVHVAGPRPFLCQSTPGGRRFQGRLDPTTWIIPPLAVMALHDHLARRTRRHSLCCQTCRSLARIAPCKVNAHPGFLARIRFTLRSRLACAPPACETCVVADDRWTPLCRRALLFGRGRRGRSIPMLPGGHAQARFGQSLLDLETRVSRIFPLWEAKKYVRTKASCRAPHQGAGE